jgi:DNA-binding GntR family transcriptional regulator
MTMLFPSFAFLGLLPVAILGDHLRPVKNISILHLLIECGILQAMAISQPTRATGTPVPRPTLTEQVFLALRDDILGGRLEPGSKLPFATLTARYGSSTSAVREGLQRLVEQGLVVSEPQLGFRVAAISLGDLDDLTDARCEIEGTALRWSVEHGDLAWEAMVVATLHTLERTPAVDDHDAEVLSWDWACAHREFHGALIAGCPNRRILDTAASLRDSAELYRTWSLRSGGPDRDIAAEHRAIADAALARDAGTAVALLRDHLEATRDAIVRRVDDVLDASSSVPHADRRLSDRPMPDQPV